MRSFRTAGRCSSAPRVTLDASRVAFHYKDFRNIKYYGLPQYQPGAEPLYQFNATVYQLYMSMFF